jgi:hypothetical protein
MPVALDLTNPEAVADELRRLGVRMIGERELPGDVRVEVRELAEQIAMASDGDLPHGDPYLLVSLTQAAFRAFRGAGVEDAATARREVRIAVEQLRQVLRDLSEAAPTNEDVPAKQVAQWLSRSLDVSQPRLAALLSISPRQLSRWLSDTDAATPSGDDARRVRTVARVAQQLRHNLSGPGVVAWFEHPHRDLDGESPLALLRDAAAAPRLVRLAGRARSHGAT